MGSSALIFVVLVLLIVAMLPAWKHSYLWGGGYAPSIFIAVILAAHTYTMVFPGKQ